MRSAFAKASLVGGVVMAAIVAMTIPAGATISSPASGATVHGTITISATGTGTSGTTCDVAQDIGDDETTTEVELETSGGGVLYTATSAAGTGTVPESTTYETELQPNGSYKIVDIENYYHGTGFLSLGCSETNNTYSEAITISNTGSLAYTGATSGDAGQTVPVSATLTDTTGVPAPSGLTVSFALSGGGTVTGTTNASGQVSANLPLNGPARTATVSVSYAGGYYSAASTTHSIVISPDPTSTSVVTTATNYGNTATITSTVTPQFAGQGTPSGTIQFTENGANVGSPVTLVGGSASFSDASLPAGNNAITAVYSGDTTFGGSTGAGTQVVNAAPTSISVASSVTPSSFGESLTYTATVITTANGPDTGTPSGNVTFSATPTGGSAEPIGGAVPLVPSGTTGTATATSAAIAILPAGSYIITATFVGSANYATSTNTASQTINPAGTVVTVASSSPIYAVYGQSIQFTATVASVLPGAGIPTGSVDFNIDGTTDLGSVPLSGGSATSPPVSNLATDELHVITATYTNSDGNYQTGTQGTLTQTVLPDQTTTTVSSSPNPSVYGQPVTFGATVAANAPGAGVPTGIVIFSITGTNGTTFSDPDYATETLSNGVATAPSDAALLPGSYIIGATYYNGDGDFVGSTENSVVQVVNQDPTTTVVTSSVEPTVFGQPVTFTASVTANTPGAGTPTGTVTFQDGSTTLGTSNLSDGSISDTATFTTAALAVGSHAITAIYSGDSNFLTSNDGINQTVNQAETATTITQNGTSVQGQPVTFSAGITAVAPGAGTPTGTVQFSVNGVPLGGPITLDANAEATSPPITTLTPGTYEATATYSGDIDFLGSTETIGQIVAPASTATTLTASPSPDTAGTPVSVTATVTPTGAGDGNPTGTVDFYDGTNLLGSATLATGANGTQATLSGLSFGVGTHSLTAVYLGEYDYLGSTSSAVPESVSIIGTTTAVTSSANPSAWGGAVTFTATVTPASGTGPGVGGTVTFSDGSTVLGTAPISDVGGKFIATYNISTLAVGAHSISASYSGAPDYGASTSSALTQTVNKAATTIVASEAGFTGAVSATLTSANGPLAGQTLVFTAGSTTLCSAVTSATGVATCTATGLTFLTLDATGSYTVTYAGNTDNAGTSAKGAAQ